MFIAIKTEGGTIKGKISFYCINLGVTRQGFHHYLKYKDKPWKFKADKPLEKCVTDMTEVKCLDDKLYVSAIFDCFDSAVLGLAMDTSMKATLCEKTLENTYKSHPGIRGCILPSDRGTQYTSERYCNAISKYGILQSMNRAGGRCHDNARCESMWKQRL